MRTPCRDAHHRLVRREGVAVINVAAVETALKPGIALLGSAVGEAVGNDPALALLLQTIVADRLRGIQRLFQIALLQNLFILHVMPPHAGKTVGL